MHLPLRDRPDLIGLTNASEYRQVDGTYRCVPQPRIPTLAEAKPAFLCLSVKPDYYQILFSEPSGTFASVRFPWDNLDPLASFFYTIYVPPLSHFYRGETIMRKAVMSYAGATADGKMICDLGDAWGRRTTVFFIREH